MEGDKSIIVYKTKDYDAFTFLKGNRSIFQNQVTRLILSLQQKNLLPENPIIVNEKKEIIDGQHRLLAAKALGIEIYYIIKSNTTLQDTILLNNTIKKWATIDYLNSYINLEKPIYKELKQFIEEFHISCALGIMLFTGEYNYNLKLLNQFKEGKLIIKDKEEANQMAILIGKTQENCIDGSWHDRNYLKALHYKMKEIGFLPLLKAIEKSSINITRRITEIEYLNQLQEIINNHE